MQLHTILKFGTLVTAFFFFDPLKTFQNLFVQMPDNIYGQSKFAPYISHWEAIKYNALGLWVYNYLMIINAGNEQMGQILGIYSYYKSSTKYIGVCRW